MTISNSVLTKIENLSRYNQSDFESYQDSLSLSSLLSSLFHDLSAVGARQNNLSSLKTNLTIIKARLKKSAAIDSQEVTSLRQRIKAISAILKPQKSPREENIIKDVALTELENGYFLGFSNSLAESTDDTALEMILSSLDPKKCANILYFNLSACPKLTKEAIILLLRFCPKLQYNSFASIYAHSRFLDHILKVQDETINVNAAVLSHYVPNIMGSGFKENKEGCTVIEETSPQALKDLLDALADPTWIGRQQECSRLIELFLLAERFLLTDICKRCEDAIVSIISSDAHELDQSAITNLNSIFKPFFTLNRYQKLSQTLQNYATRLICDTVTSVDDIKQAFEADFPMNRTQVILTFANLALGMDRGGSKILEELNILAKQYTSAEEYPTTRATLQKIGYEQLKHELLNVSDAEFIRRLDIFLEGVKQGWNLLDFTPKPHLNPIIEHLAEAIMISHYNEAPFPNTLEWFCEFLQKNGWNRPEINTVLGLLHLYSWQDRETSFDAAKQSFEKALARTPAFTKNPPLALFGLIEVVFRQSHSEDISSNINEMISKCNLDRDCESVAKFYWDLFHDQSLSLEWFQNSKNYNLEKLQAMLFTVAYATGLCGVEKNLEKARHFFEMTSLNSSDELYPFFSHIVSLPITLDLLEEATNTDTIQVLLSFPFVRLLIDKVLYYLEELIQNPT